MRVLHVVEVDHGGVVTYVRELARLQARAGVDVHVVSPEATGGFAGTVHRWSPRRTDPASLLGSRGRLRSLVADLAPDVVHLHSFFPGLLGRLGPLPARVVYQPHSWAFAAGPASARRLVVALERRALRHCDAVVVNCAAERDEARRHGLIVDPHVVGVPLDVRRFAAHDLPRPPQLRQVGAASAIVCVGRISAQKGQVELVRAWERAPVAGAVLVLVGPGRSEELREAAPTTFDRSVLHVGAQPDVRPFLRNAAVGVLASRYEGQSVAMAETLACGVPMVMTDVNGAREAIAPSADRVAGAVVPVGELDLLLAEAARRVHDPVLRAHEAARARANALELFDPPAVLRRVMIAYTLGERIHARTAGAA